mgnify:CR=1 FL=1
MCDVVVNRRVWGVDLLTTRRLVGGSLWVDALFTGVEPPLDEGIALVASSPVNRLFKQPKMGHLLWKHLPFALISSLRLMVMSGGGEGIKWHTAGVNLSPSVAVCAAAVCGISS